jgi:hypothetical protein
LGVPVQELKRTGLLTPAKAPTIAELFIKVLLLILFSFFIKIAFIINE